MDVITQIRLLWLGGLGALYGVALGTVWLLGGWQHRREQRRSRLLERVRRQFPVELRDQITMQIRGTMFGRRAVITVDMGNHAPEAWWSLVTGLSSIISCRRSIRALVVRLTDGGTHMKYMLLIDIDEQALSETTREECDVESVQLTYQLKSPGQYLPANRLHPTSTATSVRMRDCKALVTDGPFAETREQLGG